MILRQLEYLVAPARLWTSKMIGELIADTDERHVRLNATAARAVETLKQASSHV
jgi:hypothetical protein